MKQRLNKKIEQEKLQQFIFEIDDILEKFIDELNQEGYDLDYTLESLSTLEKFILNKDITNQDEHINIRTNCWIYLGETFRRIAQKGIWEVSMNDDNTMNYGLYVIAHYNEEETEFVPIRYIKAFIIKKEQGFLKSVIKNHINPDVIDLDNFPTEK
ncbi:hypothetical protein ACIRNY_07020 [Capnocytophaga canimorsus]|uniref:hypothetical protein n=1 Tax=Capnocytophaga canimorsus TaxID=28188 RepID=UPI00384DF2BE